MCFLAICVSFHIEMSVSSFSHFILWCWFWNSWRRLSTSHLSEYVIWKYFFQTCGFSSHFLDSVFLSASLFSKNFFSNLSMFFLLRIMLLVLCLRTLWLTQGSEYFLLSFLLRVFLVLDISLKSMFHFELDFAYDVKYTLRFISLAYRCPTFPALFFDKMVLLCWIAIVPLSKHNWPCLCESISGLCSIDPCLPFTNTTLSWFL